MNTVSIVKLLRVSFYHQNREQSVDPRMPTNPPPRRPRSVPWTLVFLLVIAAAGARCVRDPDPGGNTAIGNGNTLIFTCNQ